MTAARRGRPAELSRPVRLSVMIEETDHERLSDLPGGLGVHVRAAVRQYLAAQPAQAPVAPPEPGPEAAPLGLEEEIALAISQANLESGYARYALRDAGGSEVRLTVTGEVSGAVQAGGLYQLPHQVGALLEALRVGSRNYRARRNAVLARVGAGGRGGPT